MTIPKLYDIIYTRGEKDMTKKQEKIENSKHRGSWFGVNPQTKIVPNKKKEQNKKQCRDINGADRY